MFFSHLLVIILLLHPPLPFRIDEASSISGTPRALLSPEETPSASPRGVRLILLSRHATDAEHECGEEEAGNSGPHEAEVVAAQSCSMAGGAESVAAFDVGGAVGGGSVGRRDLKTANTAE